MPFMLLLLVYWPFAQVQHSPLRGFDHAVYIALAD